MSLHDLSSWQSQAACRGEDLDTFYPSPSDRGPGSKETREKRAKGFCAGCAVREECLEDALARNDKWGIWGGLNEDQRAAERRRRQRQALKDAAA